MKVKLLLNELRKSGVHIELVDSQLKINAPSGILTAAYIEEIKTNREAIIAYLMGLNKSVYAPIPRVEEQWSYPLSNSQKRLWVLSQLEGGSAAYNMPMVYKLGGPIDEVSLGQAFSVLENRHESLRTVFLNDQGEPRQRVLEAGTSGFQLNYADYRNTANGEQKALDEAMKICTEAFDLEYGPLLRAGLYRTGEQVYLLVFCIHHIVSDEWSMQVLVRELLQLYNAGVAGQPLQLPELQLQYRDYAAWQQQGLSGTDFMAHRNYWLEQFSGELPVLDLPGDYRRPAVQRYQGAHLNFAIDEPQSRAFMELLQEQQATPFMGLLSLVNVLLYRYTGQEDLILGTPVAGRSHPDLEGQIGFYVNTLALRNQVNGEEGFVELLSRVRERSVASFSHQDYPFDLLVEELGIRRDQSHSPLFDVMVVWQSGVKETWSGMSFAGVVPENTRAEDSISKFDLTIFFEQSSRGFEFQLEYNTAIYKPERMERLAEHLKILLSSVIEKPLAPLVSLDYLPSAERRILLKDFNATDLDFALPSWDLVSGFERQAAALPSAVAVVYQGVSISYSELNERSNRIAGYLRRVHGAGPGKLIGLRVSRSIELLSGILGILKSGAAYIPIDPEYPAARVDGMIADSGLEILLTDDPSWQQEMARVVLLDDPALFAGSSAVNSGQVPSGEDLAYVIYTSGSTGRPKGVMISHRSAVNVLMSVGSKLAVSAADRWLAVTTFAFDMSVIELFLPLLNGGAVILASSEAVHDPELLKGLLEQQQVSIMQATPGMWNMLVESGWAGRSDLRLLSGGEALGSGLARELLSRCGTLWNLYGPTETTVYSTGRKVSLPVSSLGVSIGGPVANTQVYVVDGVLGLRPIGVPGELCIAGTGVASGYLHNPELSASRFVSNPYGAGLLYRTGDLVSWTISGELEFHGRIDNQVKIRGYRIEPGEIEQVMEKHPEVMQAVVVSINRGEDKILSAYYTSATGLPATALRLYVREYVPEYMVPSHFTLLEELPLTPNGKIDRKNLPDPVERERVYHAPEGEIEQQLATIWEQVLGYQPVGREDNFFEIGGHSLKAIQVISRIFKELAVKLELQDLFSHPSLSALSEEIEVQMWVSSPSLGNTGNNTDEIIL